MFLDVIFLAHSGHFILPISMLVYNFLLVRRMSWCYALRMSVVDDATLQMSFVDVYVVDDAIRYKCRGRRQLHTHTTSQALEVLVRWYAAKNSHRQDPQHTWRTLWLNMCKWAQFWRVEESYCDWPMSSPTRLLTNVVSLFLAFVARFWNCDNETSASVGISNLYCLQ